jgi:eukaryotic-like serine/threonine-protein kinase
MQGGLPEPGDVVADKYVVEGLLGRGGMGAVYCVVHRVTGKRLALKCLLPAFVDNPSIVERFLREARAAGRIQHRQVIDVFDVGRDGGVLFLVMPLLDGQPLSERLHDETLTLGEALLILVRAMEGVDAAHALGIIHRDLKPGNVFVCRGVSGRLDDPRVLDFGISKLDDELDEPLTRSGVTVGTPYYMALEQLTGQRDLDARVDVYAMGVILYEAIAGRPPHTADNVASLAIRLMHTPPTHLGVLRPDLPAGLADAVMKALARDRGDRYPSIRAFIDEISRYIPGSAGLHVPEPQGSPLRTPRDSAEPTLALDMARASAPTAPSASKRAAPRASEETTPASVAPATRALSIEPNGADIDRDAATPALSSRPPAAAERGRVVVVTALSATFLLLATLGSTLFSRREGASRAPPKTEERARSSTETRAEMPQPARPSALTLGASHQATDRDAQPEAAPAADAPAQAEPPHAIAAHAPHMNDDAGPRKNARNEPSPSPLRRTTARRRVETATYESGTSSTDASPPRGESPVPPVKPVPDPRAGALAPEEF